MAFYNVRRFQCNDETCEFHEVTLEAPEQCEAIGGMETRLEILFNVSKEELLAELGCGMLNDYTPRPITTVYALSIFIRIKSHVTIHVGSSHLWYLYIHYSKL